MSNILFLMMAGNGTRMKSDIPKQYIEINGVRIYQKILNLYANSGLVEYVVLINNKKFSQMVLNDLQHNLSEKIFLIDGSDSRNDSIKCGINFLDKIKIANDSSLIFIHDATHPYLDIEASKKLISNMGCKYEAGTIVTHIWDTVYECNMEDKIRGTLNRTQIGVGASPEVFKWKLLKHIFNLNPNISKYTSVGNMMESYNIPMTVVWSELLNLKLTHKSDLDVYLEAYKYFDNTHE